MGSGHKSKGRQVGVGGKGSISRRLRKELTGVAEEFSDKNRLLVRFQDGFEKVLSLNQLTILIV